SDANAFVKSLVFSLPMSEGAHSMHWIRDARSRVLQVKQFTKSLKCLGSFRHKETREDGQNFPLTLRKLVVDFSLWPFGRSYAPDFLDSPAGFSARIDSMQLMERWSMSHSEMLDRLGNIPENEMGLSMLIAQMQTPVGVVPFVGAGISAPFGF